MMTKKIYNILSITNLMLFSALGLSVTAAWYSIMGLTAIFPGAVVPIIIVGSILEFAKIVTTVWLHKYWHKTPLLLKTYLVPAVLVLALITSMGVFGFLSKAHIEQGIPVNEISSKIELIDQKITIEQDKIQSARQILSQMDNQVNSRLDRSNNEQGIERSVVIRRQQAPERNRLLKEIQTAQETITKLNEEKLPITVEYKKIESEVGPIKYVAALIYGENTDKNMLESAVRYVIILIVIVFDPLALMSVIASNSSRRWDTEKKEVIKDETKDTINVPITNDINKIEQPIEEKKLDIPINDIKTPTTDYDISVDSGEPTTIPTTNVQETKVVEKEIKVEENVIEQQQDYKLPYELLPDNYVVYNGKLMKLKALKELHPELFILKKNK